MALKDWDVYVMADNPLYRLKCQLCMTLHVQCMVYACKYLLPNYGLGVEVHDRHVDLVSKRGWGVVGLRTGGVVSLKSSTDGGMSVSSSEFLFHCTQICLFLKNHHFGKHYDLIFLYIVGYNNISWWPHDQSISKSGGVAKLCICLLIMCECIDPQVHG